MGWLSHYSSSVPSVWSGRPSALDTDYVYQQIHCIDLQSKALPQAPGMSFALLGFCSDIGVVRNHGRAGAAQGPDSLRQALGSLAWPNLQCHLLDVGNIKPSNDDLESAQQTLAELVAHLLSKGYFPIILGGGHEVAWGHYQGIRKNVSNSTIGIINFDAHFDLRPTDNFGHGHSGSSFEQIAATGDPFHYLCLGIQPYSNPNSLIETAKQLKVDYATAEQITNQPKHCQYLLKKLIHDVEKVYLTLCLDVFNSAFVPGVSAPQAFGLSAKEILPLFRKVIASKKVISFDVAELAPNYDRDGCSAKLAASFVLELISGITNNLNNLPRRICDKPER